MKKIPRINVSDAVYSAVKQVLLSNRYSPGERIGVDDLCRQLEVSRTPVFDALTRLKAEGMVDIVPRKGVYLVMSSLEKAQEIYRVREVLEGLATSLAAQNLTPRYAGLLKAALDRQASCVEAEDYDGYARATIGFHNTILEAADSETLSRILGAIYAQIEALRLRTLYLPRRIAGSFAEHQRIYEAVVARDPAAAEAEARKHIEITTSEVRSVLAGAVENQESKELVGSKT